MFANRPDENLRCKDLTHRIFLGAWNKDTWQQERVELSSLVAAVANLDYAASLTPALGVRIGALTLNIGTLTGDVTIQNPTGTLVDGQVLNFRFQQNGVGNHAVNFGDAFVFGDDVTTDMLPTEADARWEMGFRYHAGSGKWRCMALAAGF